MNFVIKLFAFSVFVAGASSYADRYKRPMEIHKSKNMGLEIWTEYEPKWATEIMHNGATPIFVAHSPLNTYPPIGMMWVNHGGLAFQKGEFKRVAKSTLKTAAKNYKISKNDLSALRIIASSYGDLIGYEVNFKGELDNKSVDVKVFTGRTRDKGPITMQAYTSEGKMSHIAEQVRRSWSHTKYLD